MLFKAIIRYLALDDQEKIVFVTPIGNYHYKVMLFGLKNVGSTYQRMMTRMFKAPLGKKIEIYIDDMVVKSKVEFEHVDDLESIFVILRKHKLPREGGGSIYLHCSCLSYGEFGADTG